MTVENKKRYFTACGLDCRECNYFSTECPGCNSISGAPFWVGFVDSAICSIFDCCILGKNLDHCGHCNEFPCDIFLDVEKLDPYMSEEDKLSSTQRRLEFIRSRKD